MSAPAFFHSGGDVVWNGRGRLTVNEAYRVRLILIDEGRNLLSDYGWAIYEQNLLAVRQINAALADAERWAMASRGLAA